jgi:CBS domain-containing protein
MRPQLRVYDHVEQPFGPVAEALAADPVGVIRRATHAATADATLHAQIGPIDVTRDIAIEIGPMDDTPRTGQPMLRIPIAWHALRASYAFPVMQAELSIYPLTSTDTQLELVGTYDPPLGPLGRAIDRAALHGLAEASVLRLLQQIARCLREALRETATVAGTRDAALEGMKLRELMKPGPITVTETTSLWEAYRLMTDHHIRHLPVIRGDALCGILSERDLLDYRARTAFREDWWRAPVGVAMTWSPQTAGPEDSLTEVAGRLALAKIGALPVVERGKLLGLVTVTDVLEAEVREAMAG